MGTNYYAIWSIGEKRSTEDMDGHSCWVCKDGNTDRCEWEVIHIGKFSAGNVVMLRAYPDLGIFTLEGLIEFLRAKRATVFSGVLDTVGIDTLERRIRDWGSHWPRPLAWYRLNHHDWRPDGKPWAFTLEEFS